MVKTAYFRVISKEDEKSWKEFLKHYFPNSYASDILNKDLYHGQNDGGLQNIGVNIDGYGYVSGICIVNARPILQRVHSFEEFKQTDIYKEIVAKGPTQEVGECMIVHAIK